MLLKKRILPLALSVIMAMSALTGCGSSSEKDSSSGAETTLTMWTIATESDSFHKPYLQAIKEFEKNHPGVKINMETFENESYKTKIKAAVAANELPDIFFTWSGGFSESFVSSGKVMCLDDYYKNYEKEISKTAPCQRYLRWQIVWFRNLYTGIRNVVQQRNVQKTRCRSTSYMG